MTNIKEEKEEMRSGEDEKESWDLHSLDEESSYLPPRKPFFGEYFQKGALLVAVIFVLIAILWH